MIKENRTSLEAATFRRLLEHLSKRKDVQNLDLMDLAGFCRNCLSRWYSEEAQKINLEIDEEAARELIYGMPYKTWKEKFQTKRSEKKVAQVMDKSDEAQSN